MVHQEHVRAGRRPRESSVQVGTFFAEGWCRQVGHSREDQSPISANKNGMRVRKHAHAEAGEMTHPGSMAPKAQLNRIMIARGNSGANTNPEESLLHR